MSLAGWNLPWPELMLPPYCACELGDWRLKNVPQIEQFGYFQDWQGRADMFVLFNGETSWMSSARDEIDSQAPHVAAAHGHALLLGAGMGIALFNMLASPRVERLTLVERDPLVLELLEKSSRFSLWPGYDKLHIEIMDALDYRPVGPVDSLYADIWATPGEPQTIREMQDIQEQVQARVVSWWGQEIHYLEWLKPQGLPSRESYQAWARELDLPLIEQDSPAYIASVRQAARSYCYRSFLQDSARNPALILDRT
jgi:hypothetical protein